MLLHPLNADAEQAERPTARSRRVHYLTGWPSYLEQPPENEPHITCGDEDGDWNADESEVTCPDCFLAIGETYGAHKHRKAEIDQWLAEIGAHVIHVQDLGAALEAREHGEDAIASATMPGKPYDPEVGFSAWDFLEVEDPDGVARVAARAAHLARVALGEA